VTADWDCAGDHCVTCADEGIPMRVVEVAGEGLALCVAEGGDRAEVMTDLVLPVEPGDAVLVHAGVAIARLEEAAA
jgi:hydrogenase assembly chaperone HypC/HupF